MNDLPTSRSLRLLLAPALFFWLLAWEIGDSGFAEVRSSSNAEYSAVRPSSARLLVSSTTPVLLAALPLPGHSADPLAAPAVQRELRPNAAASPDFVLHTCNPAFPRPPPESIRLALPLES